MVSNYMHYTFLALMKNAPPWLCAARLKVYYTITRCPNSPCLEMGDVRQECEVPPPRRLTRPYASIAVTKMMSREDGRWWMMMAFNLRNKEGWQTLMLEFIFYFFIRFGLNVALTHENRSYRDSETKENVEE